MSENGLKMVKSFSSGLGRASGRVQSPRGFVGLSLFQTLIASGSFHTTRHFRPSQKKSTQNGSLNQFVIDSAISVFETERCESMTSVLSHCPFVPRGHQLLSDGKYDGVTPLSYVKSAVEQAVLRHYQLKSYATIIAFHFSFSVYSAFPFENSKNIYIYTSRG